MHLSKISLALRQWGAGAWSPSSLFASGEQGAWYDPSDLSTMFQDSAGTTPVTADGQPVGRILDKSGRNNHASQATAAKRPLYKTSGGLHWLQFDGVDDALATANISFATTSSIALFSGSKLNTGAAISALVETGNPTSVIGAFTYLTGDSGAIRATSNAGNANSGLNSQNINVQNLSLVSATQYFANNTDNNGITTFRGNGANLTRIQFASLNPGLGPYGNLPLSIGSRGGASLFFAGNLYSAIVLGRTANTQEVTDTEAWVAAKTGATLP